MNEIMIVTICVSAMTATIVSAVLVHAAIQGSMDRVRAMDPKLLDLIQADKMLQDNIKTLAKVTNRPGSPTIEYELHDEMTRLIGMRTNIAIQIAERKAVYTGVEE